MLLYFCISGHEEKIKPVKKLYGVQKKSFLLVTIICYLAKNVPSRYDSLYSHHPQKCNNKRQYPCRFVEVTCFTENFLPYSKININIKIHTKTINIFKVAVNRNYAQFFYNKISYWKRLLNTNAPPRRP